MKLLLFLFCISSGCAERVEAVVQEPSSSSKVEYNNDTESLADLKKKMADQKNVNADLSYERDELTIALKAQEKIVLKTKRRLTRTKARCKRNAEINRRHHGRHRDRFHLGM